MHDEHENTETAQEDAGNEVSRNSRADNYLTGDWIRERILLCDLFDNMIPAEHRRSGITGGITSIDLVGKAMWVTFVLVLLSGIGLLAGYSPVLSGSFTSVENIQNSMPFGWWLRGVHKWGTDLFIILAIIRIFRIIWRRAYRPPGELSVLVAIGCLIVAIAGALTGYLLVWSQNTSGVYGGLGLRAGYMSTLFGVNEISQVDLSNIFALHIILGFLIMVIVLRIRTMPRSRWPQWRDFSNAIPASIYWLVIGGLTLVSLVFAPPLGSVSDGLLSPHPILADWFMIPANQMADIFGTKISMLMLVLVLLFAMALPLIDRTPVRGPRPVINAIVFSTILTCLVFTLRELGLNFTPAGAFWIILLIWVVLVAAGAMKETRENLRINNRTDEEVVEG